MEFSEIGQT